MAAYLIVQAKVTDWEKFSEYLKHVPGVIARYQGHYLARGGEIITLEGEEEALRVVLIEFPSLAKAKEWYNSDEYLQIKMLRTGATSASLIAVEGC
ncbi:MAG: DUF1330 domain-containing protein [Deltaproteobacteria bacterium]|nr:DUF1330 domain-containing protein [Deltaproteobacteria bacterium]